MLKPTIRPFVSSYTGTIYHETDSEYKQTFKCSEELLDFLLQIACMELDGYYIIYDCDVDKTECYISSNGDFINNIDYNMLHHTALEISIGLAKNQRDIVPKEYVKYYSDYMAETVMWLPISENTFPKDKWLLIETSDKAQHIAYYSKRYEKWTANSEFGGEPTLWTEVKGTRYI